MVEGCWGGSDRHRPRAVAGDASLLTVQAETATKGVTFAAAVGDLPVNDEELPAKVPPSFDRPGLHGRTALTSSAVTDLDNCRRSASAHSSRQRRPDRRSS